MNENHRRTRCRTLWAQQDGLCFYCGRSMPDPDQQRTRHRKRADSATIEHVTPKAAGGAAEWRNEVAACLACNRAKADQPANPIDLQRLDALKERIFTACSKHPDAP